MLMATIWLADMGDFDEMNTIWDALVADIAAPARATCGVGPATRAYKVEIIVTAAAISHASLSCASVPLMETASGAG